MESKSPRTAMCSMPHKDLVANKCVNGFSAIPVGDKPPLSTPCCSVTKEKGDPLWVASIQTGRVSSGLKTFFCRIIPVLKVLAPVQIPLVRSRRQAPHPQSEC